MIIVSAKFDVKKFLLDTHFNVLAELLLKREIIKLLIFFPLLLIFFSSAELRRVGISNIKRNDNVIRF